MRLANVYTLQVPKNKRDAIEWHLRIHRPALRFEAHVLPQMYTLDRGMDTAQSVWSTVI